MIQESIARLKTEIESAEISDAQSLEAYRLKYLVRKGSIAELFEQMKSVPREEKPLVGKLLNELKQLAEAKFEQAKSQFAHAIPTRLNLTSRFPDEKRF
jgi:phenylalanyl-tRNA synthetase alpha chain